MQFNDPSETLVRTCEDKIIMNIKLMRAGSVAKSGVTPTVMQTMVEPAENSKQATGTQSNSQFCAATPELAEVKGLMEVQSKNLTEVTKAISEQKDTSRKAIASLTTQMATVVNAAQGTGCYNPEGVAPKSGNGGGRNGNRRGTGNSAVQYPASTRCPKVEAGKHC